MSDERHSAHDPRHDDRHGDSPHARPPGHEREIDRDINLRGVGITVLSIFLLTVVAMFAMWVMFEVFLQEEIEQDPRPSPIAEASEPRLPPGPRLQESPEAELEAFRARENAQLSSYGWVDREAGIVRIPISRAMDVLASRSAGAMSRTPDPVADAAGDGTTPQPAAGPTPEPSAEPTDEPNSE